MNNIEGGLWLGDIRAAENPRLLAHYGITHMLSIGYFPRECPAEIKQLKISILDSPNAKIMPYLNQAADFIKECLDNNGKILVHW
jgi:hypothetical protein